MIAAAGSLGQLIPPSSAILQYCAMAGTDEGQMFKVGAGYWSDMCRCTDHHHAASLS